MTAFFSYQHLNTLFAEGPVIRCSKKGIAVPFTIPDCDGEIVTMEGLQRYLGRTEANGAVFHVLVSSFPYPVLVSEFLKRYEVADDTLNCSNGIAFPRALPVEAIQAIEEGQLATSWGSVLLFSPGSFILRYKPNEDDFAAIDENVFYATYTIETL